MAGVMKEWVLFDCGYVMKEWVLFDCVWRVM